METTMNDPNPPPGLEPPPAPVGTAFKRLYRAPNTFLGGVATGLAGYFDIDPVITRLLFVVALLTGVGLPAYMICWIVIPKAKIWPAPGYEFQTGGSGSLRLPSSVASGLLIVLLAGVIGTGLNGAADYLFPAALLGFGIYLLNQQGVLAQADGQPLSTGAVAVESPDSDSRLNGSLITPTVFSLLALGLGLALALNSAGVWSVSVPVLAASGLGLVGLGLVASIWLGRAPGLVITGALLSCILVISSAVAPWLERWEQKQHNLFSMHKDGSQLGHVVGKQSYAPLRLSELQSNYSHGVGQLTVDLRQLDLQGETREMHLSLGVGELKVLVPPHLPVKVYGRVGFGESRGLVQLGTLRDGQLLQPDLGKLVVHYRVGMGKGSVLRDR